MLDEKKMALIGKKRRRTFASEEERKEARKIQAREYARKWYAEKKKERESHAKGEVCE